MAVKKILKFLLIYTCITVFSGYAFYLAKTPIGFKLAEIFQDHHPTRVEFENYHKRFNDELDFSMVIKSTKIFSKEEIIHLSHQINGFIKKNWEYISGETLLDFEFLTFVNNRFFFKPIRNENSLDLDSAWKHLNSPLYKNNFITQDKKKLIIGGRFYPFKNIEIERKTIQILEKFLKDMQLSFPQYQFYSLGTKIAQFHYYKETIRNQNILTPVLLLLLSLIVFLILRSIKQLILFLTILLLAYAFIIYIIVFNEGGISSYSGFAMFFTLIVATSDLIHFFTEYNKNKNLPQKENLKLIKENIFWPCFVTSLTTVVCFISLIFNSLIPIRNIGIYASLGSLVAFFLTFYLLPTLILQYDSIHSKHRGLVDISQKISNFLFRFSIQRPKIIISLFFSFTLIFLFPLKDLRIDDNFYNKFSKNHSLTQAVNIFKNDLGKLGAIDLEFQFKNSSEYPSNKQTHIDAFFKEIESHAGVSYHQGFHQIPSYVKSILPEMEKEKYSQSFLNSLVLGNLLGKFYHRESQVFRSYIFLHSTSSQVATKVLKDIQLIASKYKDHFEVAPRGFISYRTLIFSHLISEFLTSFGFSLGIIFVLFICIFKSPVLAFIGMIPNILPLIFISGLISILGFSLDSNFVLMLCVSLGIAVDDTIHFLWKIKDNYKTLPIQESLSQAFQKVSGALLGTTLVFTLSFPCFYLAELSIFYHVGSFIILSLLLALATDLFLLPAILVLLKGT